MSRGEGEDAPSPSAARLWAPLARFIQADRRVATWAAKTRFRTFLYEFIRFGVKEAWACLFGALMLALIVGSHYVYPAGAPLARYDFLVVAAVCVQVAMLAFRLETFEEAWVILIFHVVGTVMEVFKTGVGSWVYPEASVLRIAGVPLFSGFMYAAIGSYIARAWRLFDLRFAHHPPLWSLFGLSAAIYVNFFTHHYLPDVRLLLFAASALLFGRTWIFYRIHRAWRSMPLLLGLMLVALFIWFAENLGTFTAAWIYPNQRAGFALVPFSKLGAWFLLMMISYTLVAWVNGVEEMGEADVPDLAPEGAVDAPPGDAEIVDYP